MKGAPTSDNRSPSVGMCASVSYPKRAKNMIPHLGKVSMGPMTGGFPVCAADAVWDKIIGGWGV